MNEQPRGWKKWVWPLRSRKVQVAVATVLVAYAAQVGFVLSEDTVVTVLGVGVALILGIDRPLDMLRTVVNVTGDSTVSSIVASTENQLDVEKFNE